MDTDHTVVIADLGCPAGPQITHTVGHPHRGPLPPHSPQSEAAACGGRAERSFHNHRKWHSCLRVLFRPTNTGGGGPLSQGAPGENS